MRRGARQLALGAALVLPACGAESPGGEALRAGQVLELESEGGLVTATVRAEHLSTGRNTLAMIFDPSTTELVEVSAFMPAHGHGAPGVSIVGVEAGSYRVEDVVLSMPGLWDLTAAVRVGETADSLAFSVDVP